MLRDRHLVSADPMRFLTRFSYSRCGRLCAAPSSFDRCRPQRLPSGRLTRPRTQGVEERLGEQFPLSRGDPSREGRHGRRSDRTKRARGQPVGVFGSVRVRVIWRSRGHPSPEDSGIDLHDTLRSESANVLGHAPTFPSRSRARRTRGISRTLCSGSYPLPLFLCAVDKASTRLRVYHTCPRFYSGRYPHSLIASSLSQRRVVRGNAHNGRQVRPSR